MAVRAALYTRKILFSGAPGVLIETLSAEDDLVVDDLQKSVSDGDDGEVLRHFRRALSLPHTPACCVCV